jgi:hypothetical protein
LGLHGVPEQLLPLQYIPSPHVPQSGMSPPQPLRIAPHPAFAELHVFGTQASAAVVGLASLPGAAASEGAGAGSGDELTSVPHP